jgi:queuine tRNA-ribosyltransferase
MGVLPTAHGPLPLPAFLPDGTRAVVRALDAGDLEACGVVGLVVNTLHLANHPGGTVVAQAGGVHRFMGWRGPIVSDSGGFQVFSLARESADLVRVTSDGLQYRRHKKDDKRRLTPEKCIQQQFDLGADILYCLDHCTHPAESAEIQRTSVTNTIDWARRCKAEFDRRLAGWSGGERPKLFAVIQGGPDPDLRRRCAAELLAVGFDGYGFGGWPIADDGALVDAVAQVAELLPADGPKHALGIGKPANIVAAFRLGYSIFDCVLPTRDARHGRLYVLDDGWEGACRRGAEFCSYIYARDDCHIRDDRPIDAGCDCHSCARYSRAYLHHLFRTDEGVAHRLATIHNLRTYARLMARLAAPDFKAWL